MSCRHRISGSNTVKNKRQGTWLEGSGQIIWRDGTRQWVGYGFETSRNANGRCRGHLDLDLRQPNPPFLLHEARLICEDGQVVNLEITEHNSDGVNFVGRLLDERCKIEELTHAE